MRATGQKYPIKHQEGSSQQSHSPYLQVDSMSGDGRVGEEEECSIRGGEPLPVTGEKQRYPNLNVTCFALEFFGSFLNNSFFTINFLN